MGAVTPNDGEKWPGTDVVYYAPGSKKKPPPSEDDSAPPAKFDEYKRNHVDGKIKDNNGDPRHGGGKNKPDATLGDLKDNAAKVEAVPVVLENFDGMDYETIRSHMLGVSENIAPGYNDTLHDVAQQIVKGMGDLKDSLDALENDGGWKGKTHDAAMANIVKSYDIPEELRKGALALGVLSEYFSQTMSTNKHNILDQSDIYFKCLTDYPKETDTVKQYFNAFARDVMKNLYSPQIKDIASHQPAVGSKVAPELGKAAGDKDKDNDAGKNKNDDGGSGSGNGAKNNAGNGTGTNDEDGNNDGNGQSKSSPPFSSPNLNANSPSGGPSSSESGGSRGGGSPTGDSAGGDAAPKQSFNPPATADVKSPELPSGSGDGSTSGGSAGGDGTPKQSFNPPSMANVKSPEIPSGSGDGSGPDSGSGSPSGAGTPAGSPPSPPTLVAKSPALPDLNDSGSALQPGIPGSGAKFDPSKLLTDPTSIAAANKLFNDPKTAEAAKKLFGDSKFADAAKTLFGDDAKGGVGLLGNPKALDAAKTLFGDPEAADAAKTLFGDPDTAKSAQKLLNDPQLGDVGKALKESDAFEATGLRGSGSTDGSGAGELGRSLLGPSGLSNAAGIPGVAAGTSGSPFEGASDVLSGIMDGVNQIVQTATQAGASQPPGFDGGLGFDGAPGGPGDQQGTGAGASNGAGAGAGGSAAGPGKLHLATAGAPVTAANLTPASHAMSATLGADASQAGTGGAGVPPGGGAGGGKGGEGKDHKGNRALRGDLNGQNLIGQRDAVVPVIGEDGAGDGMGWSADS